MRSVRFVLLLFVLLLNVPIWAQQTQTATTPTPAPQDPQAVSVLNQALVVAGGSAAINAIVDYTATGNATYHWNPDVQGSVTVRGLGLDAFRLDASLSTGVRTWIVYEGQTAIKSPDGKVLQMPLAMPLPPNYVAPPPYQSPMFPAGLAFPFGPVLAALGNPFYALTYKGIVQLDGHSVHDIHLQRVLPNQIDEGNQYQTREFFIDVSTLQIAMTQDLAPKGMVHQVRYSDYRLLAGLLLPFSISETMADQHTWEIQLSQISFNTGLQDSAFTIQ
jgi:hypothetical protein